MRSSSYKCWGLWKVSNACVLMCIFRRCSAAQEYRRYEVSMKSFPQKPVTSCCERHAKNSLENHAFVCSARQSVGSSTREVESRLRPQNAALQPSSFGRAVHFYSGQLCSGAVNHSLRPFSARNGILTYFFLVLGWVELSTGRYFTVVKNGTCGLFVLFPPVVFEFFLFPF